MDGYTVEHIATTLDVPKSWVTEATMALDENDGQPDEAQEWHDFDPDCQPVSKPPGQSEKDC